MKYILTSDDSIGEFVELGGGKAKNMAAMTQKNFPIPEWFCLSVHAYHEFIKEHNIENIFNNELSAKELSQLVEDSFLKYKINKKTLDIINTQIIKLNLSDTFLAVRSSGLDEDSADHSFAGQFSSFLYQKGMEQIELAIKKCWASAHSERAISYRREKGLSVTDLSVGVVLQKMVNSEISGVCFSRNAINPLDRDHLLISAGWGQCEGIVSGEIDTDEILVDRKSFKTTIKTNKKEHMLVKCENNHLKKIDIAADLQDKCCLTNEQIQNVSKLAMKLEIDFNSPQDCEWAIEGNKVYLVQTRPITTLPPDELFNDQRMGQIGVLWDNSNIIESYSDVTTPLTFSFASNAYRQVYIQFCEVMGVPQNIINDFSGMFRNMLGLIRGRIYYNLINWYKLVMLLPGTGENKDFMNTMMGVRDDSNEKVQDLFDELNHMPKYSFLKKLKVNLMTLYRFIRIDSIVKKFTDDFNVIYNDLRAKKYETLSLEEQKRDFHKLENDILTSWKAPIINDYLCMIFFGVLKKLTSKWLVSEDLGNLQNDLLCGQGDLDSTEPTKWLMRLADRIDNDKDQKLKEYLLSTDIKELMKDEKVMSLFDEFLDKFGFRCANELKLEEKDLHDDPTFAVNAALSYIRMKTYSIKEMEIREAAIRDKAEKVVREQISGLKLIVYSWFVKQTRRAVKNRENLRFLRTKVFGIGRNIFRGMGVNFAKLEIIEKRDDIFYLTTDEITAYLEGRSLINDMKIVIAERRSQFEEYKTTAPPPDRFFSFGPAALFNREPLLLNSTNLIKVIIRESNDPNLLYGTPCCPGKIEGEVRVAKSTDDAIGLNGEILCTERTDPGWVPLYPSCSGLLIERGSLLSHSAVVARELGLPTIVGVHGGLMKKLENGMRVNVDAGKGEIRILGTKK